MNISYSNYYSFLRPCLPVATRTKKLLSVKEIEEKYRAAAKNCDKQEDVLKLVEKEQDVISQEFQRTITEVR